MALVLLCLLAAVSVHAKYAEYGGAKMPQYGDSLDDVPREHDYKEKPPDAPAALDYKFEEEAPDKHNDDRLLLEQDEWPLTTARSIKRSLPVKMAVSNMGSDRYNIDELSKFKKNVNKNSRSKFSGRDDYSDDENSRVDQVNRRDEERFNVHRDDDLQEDVRGHSDIRHYDGNANRPVRRKPRDRHSLSNDGIDDDEYTKVMKRNFNQRSANRPSKINYKSRNDKLLSDDDEEDYAPPVVRSPKRRKFHKQYAEYNDYYDMKRVLSIKDKIPSLLRRNKAEELDVPMTITRYSMSASPMTLILAQKLASTDMPKETEMEMEVPTTLAATNIETTTAEKISNSDSPELSMAERSRLSILKKSQKKDESKEIRTKKPPVLLKVTRNGMNTVVMLEPPQPYIEPPEDQKKLFRAREVYNDSPEMLKRVKKLMRHKLVKSARSMTDLIDNWDEMICDYIDVSLLNSNSCSFPHHSWLLVMIYLVLLF